MSVAKSLGVDDFDAPNMREARAEWPRWQGTEPALAVVDDVKDLPSWMKLAEPAERDVVLAALRCVAQEDARAFLVLAWLLVPGASLLAGKLRRLVDAIDEIVAGQLWIQICEHDPTDDRYVAKKILDRVARESMAELGVGDLAKRRDPAWDSTVLVERLDESMPSVESEAVEDPREQLADLLRRALDAGNLSDADRDLLLDLAHAAHLLKAPLRRGRAGLTTPSVAQMVSEDHAMSARTVRRHAADALDGLIQMTHHQGMAL
ncbi:hypothetical protein NPS01_32680 [Nocardioides psychrotolerans]|uniref:Uncharacterized protein n=1 Tax=Nocardioides psychrotolerans TaxID=1005945 RepID=A0A1I3NV88_9ACTN|nr:hypothetical protein [Nocardioides psychrotolerans]GEP39605.1 hypothetical protein NPS01_32680 [Nocardioides psychrotolerans]SFJ13193.1 hypothetical protein SAMN05216561_1195 [Nocardioides psychrotolerans]